MATRVAVVGAGGIGRHHANWWHLEGAEVCAILGTSEESVGKAGAALREIFGFDGAAYTDFAALLVEQRPHIVDVCSPPSCHGGHVRQALTAGCHVLCEKPFVYDSRLSSAEMLRDAAALLALADGRGLRLAVSAQYGVGAEIFRAHWEKHHPGEVIDHYRGHLESPAKGRPADPARVWADLSPHVISVFTALFPGAMVVWDTVAPRFNGHEAIVRFEALSAAGGRVWCELITRNRTAPPNNVRQFVLNGACFEVHGARDGQGEFFARIETPQGVVESPDMMRLLIREFLAGRTVTDGAGILEDLSLMLAILDRV